MTEKDMNLDTAPKPEATSKAAKPAISKATASTGDAPATPAAIVTPQAARPAPKTNGDSPADAASKGREALLQVDSYAQAEALLTEHPDLIDQARAVFGEIVPTGGQSQFVDLAIKAAAEDDPTDLRDALRAKRQKHLNLTTPEVRQLLEFAAEYAGKSPVLSLNIALLLTDDLTRLEKAELWQKQKEIVLIAEKGLNLDAAALWEEISRAETKQTPPPQPEPAKVRAEPKPAPRKRPAPPPPPVYRLRRHKDGPPRWLLASGFFALMAVLSCGICAWASWF